MTSSSDRRVKIINGSNISFVSKSKMTPVQSSATCIGGVPGGQRPKPASG